MAQSDEPVSGEGAALPASVSPTRIFTDDCMAGRTAFVTGASSGLGRAAAVALSQVGAKLIVTGRNPERLDETVAMLGGEGHAAVVADLGDADQVADLVRNAAGDHGPIDGVFHSAGVFSVMPAKMTKQRHVDELFGASVPGAYGIARAAAQKNVLNDGGSVVFMSSVAGVRGNTGLAAYAGAKAAILGLSGALAVEFAPRRIRVNAIVAATVHTEMHRRMLAVSGDQQTDANASRHLLGYGESDDIANAVLFLLSDASRWITGTAMTVDGGYLA